MKKDVKPCLLTLAWLASQGLDAQGAHRSLDYVSSRIRHGKATAPEQAEWMGCPMDAYADVGERLVHFLGEDCNIDAGTALGAVQEASVALDYIQRREREAA